MQIGYINPAREEAADEISHFAEGLNSEAWKNIFFRRYIIISLVGMLLSVLVAIRRRSWL